METTVSDTARAKVAKDFRYLPQEAAEIAAAYLTLIEAVDDGWRRRLEPDPATSNATIMGTSFAHLSPREQQEALRDWQADREPYIRQLGKMLANYPRPMLIAHPLEGFVAQLEAEGLAHGPKLPTTALSASSQR